MNENKNKMIRLRVKEIAQERNISMMKLSRMSDVSFNTIRRIFKQPDKPVNTDTLDKLSRALGVSVNDLMIQLEDPPTSTH